MKLLITGAAGFIGSNLVRYLLEEHEDVEVINLDLLTYAGNLDNLAGLEADPRYRFVHGDICDAALVGELMGEVDAVLHLAAESHVDRSIAHDAPFVRTNVNGTHTLLSAALAAPNPPRFVHVSTDEVYGELPWRDPEARDPTGRDSTGREAARTDPAGRDSTGSDPASPAPEDERFTESTPLAPRSPYSATKASGDLLALAYHRTHGLDVVVTRCSNNYGPYQFPEKLIPLMVSNAMKGEPLPVYGDGLNVRDWIHVRDHCRGLDAALRKGRSGEVYNFGGDTERTNLQIVNAILERTGADPGLITFVEDRLGHDRRYAVDATKAKKELSWAPLVEFSEGLAETIAWYGENGAWLERIESGAYRG
ncbi:MAG: dTDP-glucose 4,6-dehydratase [Gemmatimonadetes bacterium]|nr:dTDP-glucose 4,6-dehydratase [Gemmatimonadota bacterium]